MPPLVTAITQLPPDGGSTALAFASVQVSFSESLDGISARSPANYELLSAGADGVLDTQDDVEIVLTPAYSFPETDLTLQFGGGVLADGLCRLRLSGTLAIYDTAGNALDGDANGSAGGDYLHVFTVDRSSNTDPVAQAQTVDVDEDASVVITLAGSDADGDMLAFGLYSNPAHGLLSGFDPVTRQFTYTLDPDYWGVDSFQFQVDDGKLGTHTATISLNVAPINDMPQAPGQVVNLIEDNAVTIVLPASDKEAPRSALVFNLVTPPVNGSVVQGSNGVHQAQRTFTIDVHNVAPTLAVGDGAEEVLLGDAYTLSLLASDPGADTLASWTIDWGDSNIETVAGSTTGVDHTYALDGAYTIAVQAMDEDGTYDAAPVLVTVTSPNLDPVAPGQFTQTDEDQISFNVTVDPDLLAVDSVEWTQTGYKVHFNRAVDASSLNLVDDTSANRGPADAVLADAAGTPVAGSIVLDADGMGFTFVRTGTPNGDGLLAAGRYNLALESRADAFVDLHGRLPDGDNNGVAGGAFAASLNQAGSTAAIVSIGEFTRGPGQDVNLPASGAGVPVRISNAAGASTVSFTVHYDPELLDVTGAVSNLPGVTVALVDARVVGAAGSTSVPVADLLAGQSSIDLSGLPAAGTSGSAALELDFRVVLPRL